MALTLPDSKLSAILQLSLSGKPSDLHAHIRLEPKLPYRQCVNHGIGAGPGMEQARTMFTAASLHAGCLTLDI